MLIVWLDTILSKYPQLSQILDTLLSITKQYSKQMAITVVAWTLLTYP